jgi:hypothetical protein
MKNAEVSEEEAPPRQAGHRTTFAQSAVLTNWATIQQRSQSALLGIISTIVTVILIAVAVVIGIAVYRQFLVPPETTTQARPTAVPSPPGAPQGTLNGAAQTAVDRGVYSPPEQPKEQAQATPIPLTAQPTGAPVVAPQPSGEKSAETGARNRSAERSDEGTLYKAGPAVAAPTVQGKQMTLDRDGAAAGVGKGARP